MPREGGLEGRLPEQAPSLLLLDLGSIQETAGLINCCLPGDGGGCFPSWDVGSTQSKPAERGNGKPGSLASLQKPRYDLSLTREMHVSLSFTLYLG